MKKWMALLLLVPVVSACDYLPFGYTEIGRIRRQPAAFEGREVKVGGEVTEVSKIPFLEIRTFTLSDGTGEIVVFALDPLPPQGEKVALRGTVESAAIIGGEAFGVRIREAKRLPGVFAR